MCRSSYLRREKNPGQWKAHGRYLAREGAAHRAAQRQAGLDGAGEKLDVAKRLDDWQRAGDPRLWKIILSPEFGDKLDMRQFARAVMAEWKKRSDRRWNGLQWHTTTLGTPTYTSLCEELIGRGERSPWQENS